MARWWQQRPVIVDGRCVVCGGRPFHKLFCPIVTTALIVAAVALILFGVVLSASASGDPGPGFVAVVIVVLVLLGISLILRIARRGRSQS